MKTEAQITSNANAPQTLLTKGISLLLLIIASIAGVTYMAASPGHADEQAAPTFVNDLIHYNKLPKGEVVAFRSHREKLNQLNFDSQTQSKHQIQEYEKLFC